MSKSNTFEVFSDYEQPPFDNIEYFLVLDTSSSMGDYIPQIIQKVIPEALSKIDYPEKKPFHLITFSNFCSHSILTRKEFPYVSIEGKGETQINLIFPKLKNILNSFKFGINLIAFDSIFLFDSFINCSIFFFISSFVFPSEIVKIKIP